MATGFFHRGSAPTECPGAHWSQCTVVQNLWRTRMDRAGLWQMENSPSLEWELMCPQSSSQIYLEAVQSTQSSNKRVFLYKQRLFARKIFYRYATLFHKFCFFCFPRKVLKKLYIETKVPGSIKPLIAAYTSRGSCGIQLFLGCECNNFPTNLHLQSHICLHIKEQHCYDEC